MAKATPLLDNNMKNMTKRSKHNRNLKKEEYSKQIQKIKKQQELRTLYAKLREIIPSCQNKSVSSLDIVLRAVDYINQLHVALEEEFPGLPKPVPTLSALQHNSFRFQSVSNSTLSFRNVTNTNFNSEEIHEK